MPKGEGKEEDRLMEMHKERDALKDNHEMLCRDFKSQLASGMEAMLSRAEKAEADAERLAGGGYRVCKSRT